MKLPWLCDFNELWRNNAENDVNEVSHFHFDRCTFF